MSEGNSPETNPVMGAPEDNINGESKERFLAQEEVDEQIRSYNAPLTKTKQLEGLTRPIQGQQLNNYPRAGTSASFSAAGYQLDNGNSGIISGRRIMYYCEISLRVTTNQHLHQFLNL